MEIIDSNLSAAINLLDTDLTGVDISRPMIAKGTVEFVISEIRVEQNKAKTGDNCNIVLKTVNKEKAAVAKQGAGGDIVNPGFTLIHTISLTTTEKYDAEAIKRNLKGFRHAVTGLETGAFGPVDQYLGKHVFASVGIDEDESGKFPPKNEIRRFVPAKKA